MLVTVDVDVTEALNDADDEVLREELRYREERRNGGGRKRSEPDPWWALQDDLDFQMALYRGDADEVFRRVQDAYFAHQRCAA